MMHGKQIDQIPCMHTVKRKMNKLNLFVTVRILLHVLSKENQHLRMIAQKVLKDSHKFHQSHPEVTSLAELIETGLRQEIGEKYWKMARAIQRRECSVSVKSVCKTKNQSVFTVGRKGNEIALMMPLHAKKE